MKLYIALFVIFLTACSPKQIQLTFEPTYFEVHQKNLISFKDTLEYGFEQNGYIITLTETALKSRIEIQKKDTIIYLRDLK
jgi:hypothetical protein